MAKLLLGKPVRESIKERLVDRISGLEKKPVLAIVQVGDRADSNTYIRNKIKFGDEVGVRVLLKKFDENIKEDELIKEVQNISEDDGVSGVIVQLPLPQNIDSNKVIESIPKNKDADGLTSVRELGDTLVTPATAKAVMSILDFYNIEVENKKITVIGRSRLAGGPISEVLKARGAEVVVCDRSTKNTKELCREADIIISAAGQINLVNKGFVKAGQTIIDVGINKITPPPAPSPKGREEEEQGLKLKSKLVGDVAFEEVEPIVSSITPVPGGVGPLTVACLFENLLDLISKK